MFRSVILVALLAVSALSATRVFMFGGQSNMVGSQTDFGQLEPELQVQPANVTLFLAGEERTFASLDLFGPEIAFGRFAARMYPDDEIVLVKRAIGGTPMACWVPEFVLADVVDGKCSESLYAQWMDDLADVLAANPSATVDAVLWDQGGRDARVEEYAPGYYDRMSMFLDSLPVNTANPDLQVVAGNVVANSATWRDTVRAAQVRLDAERDNFHLVNNDDLPMASDGKHFTNESQLKAGFRMALAYFGQVSCQGSGDPDVPSGVSGEALTSESIKLGWTVSAAEPCGLKYYLVKRDGAVVDSTPEPVLLDTGLVDNTDYQYEVAAAGFNGTVSAYSSPVTVRTLEATGDVPGRSGKGRRGMLNSTLREDGLAYVDARGRTIDARAAGPEIRFEYDAVGRTRTTIALR